MSNKSSKTIKSTAAGDSISVDGSRYAVTMSGEGSSVFDSGGRNRLTIRFLRRAPRPVTRTSLSAQPLRLSIEPHIPSDLSVQRLDEVFVLDADLRAPQFDCVEALHELANRAAPGLEQIRNRRRRRQQVLEAV